MNSVASSSTAQPRKIALIGFMGAGKTTVAEILAARLDCEFCDLDQRLEQHENQLIHQIFVNLGEPAFRRIEAVALREILRFSNAQIIALGGGAWIVEENRRVLRDNDFLVIWLDAPFEVCWKRISEGNSRPLAQSETAARQLFDQRKNVYQTADLRIIAAEEQTPAAIAESIVAELNELQPNY